MTARIFKPAKTAMQSGRGKTNAWVLEHDPKTARGIEPLMGYTSTTNMQCQVRLAFDSREDAISYAEREGLDFRVIEPQTARRQIRIYSDNFKWGKTDGNWTH